MKPLILISNDDGYQAKGLNELVRMVADYGDIIVCAPDAQERAVPSLWKLSPYAFRKLKETSRHGFVPVLLWTV